MDTRNLTTSTTRPVIALLVDKAVEPTEFLAAKLELISDGWQVRAQKRPKNPTGLLAQMKEGGATHVAFLKPGDAIEDLRIKTLA